MPEITVRSSPTSRQAAKTNAVPLPLLSTGLIQRFDGATLSLKWKEAAGNKFVMGGDLAVERSGLKAPVPEQHLDDVDVD